MAIAAPVSVVAERSQDLTVTVTLTTPTSVAGWTATATLRAYNGGPALATKTTADATQIAVTDSANGVFVVSFSAADLTQTPGAYVFEMDRTNAGFAFPIVDPSPFIIRSDSGSAYPTLTNLGEYIYHALGGTTPSDAECTQLIQLLAAAEDWVKRYCNREFVYRATVTEYPTPNGTDTIRLNRTPVDPATVVVYEDWNGNWGQTSGSFDATTSLLTLGTDYAVPVDSMWNDGLSYSGRVMRLGTVWPYRQRRPLELLGYQKEALGGSVKVVFSGGYTLIPYPIKLAIWTLTSLFAQTSPNGRLAMSESGEGESVSYAAVEDIPWTVKQPLAPFRRFVI